MKKLLIVAVISVWLVWATAGSATINIETVPVGNLGNVGELSGKGANGYGADRICGAVGYEYRMGKYEVTAGQYTAFLNKVAATDTYGLYDTNMWYDIIVTGLFPSNGCKIQRNDANGDGLWEYSVASDYANRPVNYINWGDSARFANWLHNGQPTGAQNASTTEDGSYTLNGATSDKALLAVTRKPNATWVIPSEDEWYKAAYHENAPVAVNYFDYPTGSDTAPGQDMTDASGNNANYSTGFGPYPIDSGTYYTTIVGEFQNSASPYGTFDQGGNVWEWNEAILYGSYRGLRGGSFNSYSRDLHASGREYFYSPPPKPGLSSIGFRVSRVPEPASMAILALGGLGMLVRRRNVRE